MQISLSLEDFVSLINAAEFGIKKADGFKADYTVRAWKETHDRLSAISLDNGRTQKERNRAALDAFAKQCEVYGAD